MLNAGYVSWRTLFFYAFPALALSMPTIPVYVYLPTFYAESVGLGLTATGAILLAARITDVVSDPLVGIASDREWLPGGRRKPWILLGGVIAAVSLIKLFQPPSDAGTGYLLVWTLLLYLGWTFVSVPYTAWGAEISPDYHQRSRITGAREVFQLAGVVMAAAIPALAVKMGAIEAEGIATVAWIAVAAGVPAVALLLWRVREAPASGTPVKLSRRAFTVVLRNRPFVRLLGAWFVNGFANGIPAVLFPLYLEHALQAETQIRNALIFAYFLCGILAIPIWVRLSRRFGKHRVWCGAMALACCAFVWVPMIPAQGYLLFLVVCVLTGMALGADLSLPPAMQADVVDLDSLRAGGQRAGLFFALWGMSTKLALALAVGVTFPLLDLLGFDPSLENDGGTILALAVIYAVVPTVLKIIAIIMVWGHPLTERRQRAIRQRLGMREARSAEDI